MQQRLPQRHREPRTYVNSLTDVLCLSNRPDGHIYDGSHSLCVRSNCVQALAIRIGYCIGFTIFIDIGLPNMNGPHCTKCNTIQYTTIQLSSPLPLCFFLIMSSGILLLFSLLSIKSQETLTSCWDPEIMVKYGETRLFDSISLSLSFSLLTTFLFLSLLLLLFS